MPGISSLRQFLCPFLVHHIACNTDIEWLCRWLNDKNSCPVCRKPLTEDQPQGPQVPRGSVVDGADAGIIRQHNWNNDMYASEVMFRMGRLQR